MEEAGEANRLPQPDGMFHGSDTARTAVVLAVLAAFFGGYLLGAQQRAMASQGHSAVRYDAAHVHKRDEVINVSGDGTTPRVDLVIHDDAISGRNLEVITENFRFAPEHASWEHVAGEGHAHLYIDGKKVARLYGRWFHIPDPRPGTHTIRVTLNSNTHRALAFEGRVIEDVEILTVTEQ